MLSLSNNASSGNIASIYGLLPSDMAISQAFSLFNEQVSASYYNPAALTLKPQGELTLGAFYASPSLTVKSLGGSTLLFGKKTNLTNMTRLKHPPISRKLSTGR